MAGLGNVFDALEGDGVRGADLRVSVEVPRAALGHGFRAPVPPRLAADDDIVDRVRSEVDPEHVVLYLPKQLPDGAVLRLRGQGGAPRAEGERAGDLYVSVALVERPARPGELIPRALARAESADLAETGGGSDVTMWVLLAIAVATAAALGLVFL